MRFGKPIVPTDNMRKLLQLCVEWYAMPENSVGGILHIVLDDDNVRDSDSAIVYTPCEMCKYENEAADMYPCCDCCHCSNNDNDHFTQQKCCVL